MSALTLEDWMERIEYGVVTPLRLRGNSQASRLERRHRHAPPPRQAVARR